MKFCIAVHFILHPSVRLILDAKAIGKLVSIQLVGSPTSGFLRPCLREELRQHFSKLTILGRHLRLLRSLINT